MAIGAGVKLGPYEVLAPLGAGGMGEVYRARDTRLSREVAVKVLPPEVARDESRLKRFEKEARSASALNHPNIVTIYDIGQTDGVSWIAMEKVEGKTLREMLFGGALPIRKLLPIAAQIADGLARAHEAGIVHRDLKPENVMVTKDGLVKILDFGLAKLATTGSGSDEGSQLPTETGTSPGVLLGTVGYMSPEQAGGQSIDFHSDQFSFGSILYEMATGKRAFQKKTAVDTLAAVLNDEPAPIAATNPQVPAPLRWTAERCLAKDPEQRYVSTRDLARELSDVQRGFSEARLAGAIPTTEIASRRRRLPLLPALLAGCLLAILGLLLGRQTVKPPSQPTFHRLTFRRGVSHAARFAPDGHTVIYSGHYDIREPRLFSTRPESPESAPLALPNAQLESISRSGDLALVLHPFGERILARAPLAGGSVREILENVGWADWAPDGRSLAVVRMVNGKARLEFPIGKVLFESSGFIDFPRLSPKADRVAFFDHPTAGDGSVVVVDLARKKTNLSEGWSTSTGLFWRPNGEEVWYSAGRSGADVDIRAVTLSGRDRLVYRAPMLVELFDVSPSGQVLFAKTTLFAVTRGLTAGETTERDLSWLDNSVVNDISPDGKTLVFTDLGSGAGPNSAVGLRKMDGSPTVRLGDGSSPVLSPDGKWVLAYAPHPEPAQLVLHPTGPGESRVLTHDSINHMAGAAWLPDGKRIIFPGNEPGHGARLYIQDLAGGAPRPILREGIWSGSSIFPSPDGKTVAFCCSAEKQALLSVDGGEPRPISGSGEGESVIRWTADGGSVYVVNGEIPASIYRLDVSTGRRQLWKAIVPPERTKIISNIVLSPDGKSYAYSYTYELNDLYLAGGLK